MDDKIAMMSGKTGVFKNTSNRTKEMKPLFDFYDAHSLYDLIDAQEAHIKRLQDKLLELELHPIPFPVTYRRG